MALIDDIILNKGQIVLSQNSGSAAGLNLDDSPFLFGTVVVTNDLSDNYVIGDYVLFDPTGATLFRQSSSDYFLTTEDKVFFKELTPP